MEELGDLQMYPQWLEAAKAFARSNPQPGQVITEQWKHKNFGIKPPSYGDAETWKSYQLSMLSSFSNFAAYLLAEHQIHLASDRQGGHRVLAPKEQTTAAIEDCNTGIKKALKKGRMRLENVAVYDLTADERKEHTDSVVRLSMAATMFKKVRRIAL